MPRLALALVSLLVLRGARAACTQGAPATCTYVGGASSTSPGPNGPNINPCVEYYELAGLATGYDAMLADAAVGNLSAPSPSTFCYNYFCYNAGVTGGTSTQTFTAWCAKGFYGNVTATCRFKANCWYSGDVGSIRGSLMYNFGPNQAASSVGISAAVAGTCASTGQTIYTTAAFYAGFDRTSGNSIDPTFAYSAQCVACPAGGWCPQGQMVTPDAGSCLPGWWCPGGINRACPAGTWSATRGALTDATCQFCADGTWSDGAASSMSDRCCSVRWRTISVSNTACHSRIKRRSVAASSCLACCRAG